MSGARARSLGRMPLHGGWAALRFTDPRAGEPLPPGQLARIHHADGALTLPVHLRDNAAITLLSPPGPAAAAPAADTAVTVDYPLQPEPPLPTAGQEAVVLGVDDGLGGALALAQWLSPAPTLVIVGGNAGVPARPRPSRFLVPGLPAEAIACLPQLEEQGIPSRIALADWQPGCFDEGPLTLLERYLAELPDARRSGMLLYAFTPAGLLDESITALEAALEGVHAVAVPTVRG